MSWGTTSRPLCRAPRIRRRHPLIGGLLLALGGAPAHETAWATGGRGEQSVARGLERRTANGPAILLHDRRMPGGYGNIDHLALAPRGVFVIDTKAMISKTYPIERTREAVQDVADRTVLGAVITFA